MEHHLKDELDERGYALCPAAVLPRDLDGLLAVIASEIAGRSARRRSGETYAVRSVLSRCPALTPLLENAGIDRLAETALGTPAVPVDATFFDKNAGTNWKVPAHQDLIMPAGVAPAGSPIIERFGAAYADPTDEVLRRLVAIRIHFDDCPVENGALAVVPRTHRGRMRASDFDALDREAFVPCAAKVGDVLVMSPLLVHRSSPATQPGHRRVLHVVYAPRPERGVSEPIDNVGAPLEPEDLEVGR
ncbi:MAG TPA: phytanoyl-CoA dioxygenase family protein [Marmoricola sp.]